MGEKLRVVLVTVRSIHEKKRLSALQLKKEVKWHEPTFVVVSVTERDGDVQSCTPEIIDVSQEFSGIMPNRLPNVLAPRRSVDYEIELLPGAKTPGRVPY